MQTAAQIRTQIDGVLREIDDIHRNMPGITSTTDLLGAQAELRDREAVLELLAQRLKDAEAREKQQAEDDRRQANEDTMTEARAAYADVADQLRARRLKLVRTMTAEMDESDPLLWEAQRLHNEYQEAWLRNATPEQRRDLHIWPTLPSLALDDLTDREQHAADLIGVLHASRHGLTGSFHDLQLASAAQGYQRFQAMNPQPQVQPNPNPQLTNAEAVDLISAEIRERVMRGFQDNIGEAQ